MRLRGNNISGAELELDFGDANLAITRSLTIADVAQLGGSLAIGAASIDLTAVSIASLTLVAGHWDAGRATLSLEAPSVATAVVGDLSIAKSAARAAGAPATRGTLAIGALQVARMAVTLGDRRTAFGLELEGLTYSADREGVQRISIERAIVRELQGRPGSSILRIPKLELRGVTVVLDEDGPRVEIGSIQASRLSLNGAGLELELGLIDLPGGLRANRSTIEIPLVSAAEANIAVEPLLPATSPSPAPERAAIPIDLAVLDLLAGQINVDLKVDLTLPVIGRRKATHRFRLGVENGTIDFKELEGGLSGLEDALLDFEVDGDTLVLERDIPLIPGDNKPILLWRLQGPAEVELASRNRVRLRRLRQFEIAGADADAKRQDGGAGKSKSSVQLQALALDEIDIALSMSPSQAAISLEGAGQTLEGWLQRVSLGQLKISGELHHRPEATPAASTLELGGRDLKLSLSEIPIGDNHATTDLVVSTFERVTIGFDGMRPRSLAAQLAGVSLERIAIVLPALKN